MRAITSYFWVKGRGPVAARFAGSATPLLHRPARKSIATSAEPSCPSVGARLSARACLALQREGFEPDLVIGHPGWGETMFLRDVLPRTPILSYCELFYRSEGQDTDYIPETRIDLDGRCRIRAWNADLLSALNTMDRGLSPTRWQRDQHPSVFHDRIAVIHDGVDMSEVTPHPKRPFRRAERAVVRGLVTRS